MFNITIKSVASLKRTLEGLQFSRPTCGGPTASAVVFPRTFCLRNKTKLPIKRVTKIKAEALRDCVRVSNTFLTGVVVVVVMVVWRGVWVRVDKGFKLPASRSVGSAYLFVIYLIQTSQEIRFGCGQRFCTPLITWGHRGH